MHKGKKSPVCVISELCSGITPKVWIPMCTISTLNPHCAHNVFCSQRLERPFLENSQSTSIELMPFSTNRATFHHNSGELEHWDLLPTSHFNPILTWCTRCYEVHSRVELFWLLWQFCCKLPGWIFPFHTEFVLALLFNCMRDKMWNTCRSSPWGEEKASLNKSADWCPASSLSPKPPL